MICKNCGAQNEDYLEYCEVCAAPLTPDEEAGGRGGASRSAGYASYVAATGETPPAWGFVRAPQWPKPEFDANTVTEEEIPEGYFRKFNPRPAEAGLPGQEERFKPAAVISDEEYSNNVRVHAAIAQQPSYESTRPLAPETVYEKPKARPQVPAFERPKPEAQPSEAGRAYAGYRGGAMAPVEENKAVAPKPQKPRKRAEDGFEDYDGGYGRARAHTSGGKRNLVFIAAAGVLVLLIAVFGFILISTRYDGSFSKFISCTFKGDPITRAPKVETGTTDAGDPAYLITVYAKNNYIVRFTAGSIVKEAAVSKGSVQLRVPENIWIPDEPLDSDTLSVTPDIVVVSPKGEKTQVAFDEPIAIHVPAINLTMTQPTVADFTVDSATVAVAGAVDDNTASIFVGDNQVSVDEAGNFSTNYTLPGEGTFVLEVRAQKDGCMSAVKTYNVTYGTATDPTTPSTGNVAFSVNDDVKRYGQDATMAVAGTMEQGATISVSGVELEGAITQDANAGTFSFTIKTAEVGLYEVVITATKGDAAKTSTLYLEHQPDKDAYISGSHAIDYDRIKNYPNHEQAYKISGTVVEIRQTKPYIIARIQTSEGDVIFCYFSGISAVELNDGKTYSLYADPYGLDEETGLPYMHAWFILKKAN
ncbi:MAG TPA: hypothetical protein PK438_06605 [Clostridia bacterium]|nr:MAG: hypothetical protein BWY35_01064 [Firmicutes bacterium ADurb.Bin248]HOG00022.1 hypothetical protein [Clostridia bacterium]HOS18941.1 hypothetical protein [Clostridia bacterium]HPK14499.1 hypothetical protein [Clostridia bacterium]